MSVSSRKTGKYTGLDSASLGDILQGLDNGTVASVSVDNSGSQVVCSADICSPLHIPMTRKIGAQVCVPIPITVRESIGAGVNVKKFESEAIRYAKREIAMTIAQQLMDNGIISFSQTIEAFDTYCGGEPKIMVRGELEIPS